MHRDVMTALEKTAYQQTIITNAWICTQHTPTPTELPRKITTSLTGQSSTQQKPPCQRLPTGVHTAQLQQLFVAALLNQTPII
jgi:hypothetical protein